ncbi:BTB/POZ domain-containing protein 3-like [Paramacrobiotus metropolitanus]|uniref:BTB/POZ domain-containing protein 3-like n=1 Tax=Paramacrobiotus metropolitanus TaxID=2943436 RepID=UPI0024465D22|nr:BTB/POZ domain-containing protein 3-like [Paramacrobiotus metropolitanus]
MTSIGFSIIFSIQVLKRFKRSLSSRWVFDAVTGNPTMSMNPSASSTVRNGPSSEDTVAASMQEMLCSGDLSDVHFVVGRDFGQAKEFHAHRLILAARNPVFRTMFFGSLPENGDTAIDIRDMMPEAFSNMLHFLYTGDVTNLTADSVIPTLVCADKYDLPRLIRICSDFIANHLSVDNCLTVLEQAIQWSAAGIAQKCLDLVDAQSDAVMRSDRFTDISPATLQMILQRSTLTAEENVVYLAVERWGVAACARNGLDSSAVNRRQMLGDALFLVRFPLLTSWQLANGPGQSGLLTEAEIGSIFLQQKAKVKPTAPAFSAECRTGLPNAAAPTFQPDETVFAQTVEGHWWMPATITGSNGLKLVLKWSCSGTRSYKTTDQVVRASEILQPGQPLHILYSGNCQTASYSKAAADGLHEVFWGPRTVSVPFSCLSLLHRQVTQWKAHNGR